MAYRVEILPRHGFAIDDLTDRLLGNPRYVFETDATSRTVRRLRKKARAMYRWKHKQFGGPVKLKKKDGVFWAEVPEKGRQGGPGRLLGAFVSWLFVNASEMIYRLDIRKAA